MLDDYCRNGEMGGTSMKIFNYEKWIEGNRDIFNRLR
jgi:hypothetical protein